MEEVLTTLKILIVGESGVGKSSLLQRFANDTFDPNQTLTVGCDISTVTMDINGKSVMLTIWDTAGQERFRTLSPSYYRNAHGAIFVYDVTSRLSYIKIEDWVNELDVYNTKPNMVKMIVGNKIDEQCREVSKEDGIKLAKKHASLFVECSAKNNEGVQIAFQELVEKIINIPDLWESKEKDKINLEDQPPSYLQQCRGYICTSI